MEPGTNLIGSGLFAPASVPPESFQGESRYSLFGALVQSKTTGIDVMLDIPDIPDDCTGLDVRIPKLHEVLPYPALPILTFFMYLFCDCDTLTVRCIVCFCFQSLEDEGFVDTMSISTTSMCTVSPDIFNLRPDEDMWDVALRTKRQKHYTWEHVGV